MRSTYVGEPHSSAAPDHRKGGDAVVVQRKLLEATKPPGAWKSWTATMDVLAAGPLDPGDGRVAGDVARGDEALVSLGGAQ